MPVTTAFEGQHLMISRVEVLLSQVVVVTSCWSSHFNRCVVCIKLGVACECTLGRVLYSCASAISSCPTTESRAKTNCSAGSVECECANLCVLLHLLSTNNGLAVGVNIAQRVERLANEVSNPLHRYVVVSNRNGNYRLLVVTLIGDIAYSTSLGNNISEGIRSVDHLVSLEELDVGYIVVTNDFEKVFNIILDTVCLERCQNGNLLLLTAQCTLNHDICKTNLLGIAQAVEVNLQSTLAFGRCSTSNLIRILRGLCGLVVAVWCLTCVQCYGCAVRINPGKV